MGKLAVYEGVPDNHQLAMHNPAITPDVFHRDLRTQIDDWGDVLRESEQQFNGAQYDLAISMLCGLVGSINNYYGRNPDVPPRREFDRRKLFVYYGVSLMMRHVIDSGGVLVDGKAARRSNFVVNIMMDEDGMPAEPNIQLTSERSAQLLASPDSECEWFYDESNHLVVRRSGATELNDLAKLQFAVDGVAADETHFTLSPFVGILGT